jgi:hypothetical protein
LRYHGNILQLIRKPRSEEGRNTKAAKESMGPGFDRINGINKIAGLK